MHDEGDGLLGACLAPCAIADLSAAFEALRIQSLVEISPRWGVTTDHPTPVRRLAARQGAIELVCGPAEGAPDSVLVDPHAAVSGGRQLAISISEDGHALVYAPDRRVHDAIVSAWLAARLAEAGIAPAPLPSDPLAALLEPLPDDAWHEVAVEPHQRFQVLRITTRRAGEGLGAASERRWIGGAGRAWRDGWSW